MHNLRTRIKRRKEALRKTGHSFEGSSSKSSSVEADWQFVNFNPCMYGPRKSIENGDSVAAVIGTYVNVDGSSVSGSITNIHQACTGENSVEGLTRQDSKVSVGSVQSSSSTVLGSTEDFYEFPTSTNLKQIVPACSNNANLVHQQQSQVVPSVSPEGILPQREKDGGLPCKRDSLIHQKQLRHSITSAFDLLPSPIQVQGHRSPSKLSCASPETAKAKAVSSDSVVVTVSKSNSVLSTSSSSSSTPSVSACSSSGCSSNPVSRSSSSRFAPAVPQSQSKFYIPSPAAPYPLRNHHHASRPPLPLPRDASIRGSSRPHSWDADFASGALVNASREFVYVKKRREDNSRPNSNHSDAQDSKRNSYHNAPYDELESKNKSRKIPSLTPSPQWNPLSSKPVMRNVSKNVSPMVGRIPKPPPLPSYSLEEWMNVQSSVEQFPAPPPRQPKSRSSSRPPPPPPQNVPVIKSFNSRVSAVGSLCLSLINPNSNHACMFLIFFMIFICNTTKHFNIN